MPRQFPLRALKSVIAATVLSFATYAAHAATPLPPELVGVWAKAGSEFAGDALMKGAAVYLDSDGVGAGITSNGTDAQGVQLTVTAYDASTHVVTVDFTDHGKVIKSGSYNYNTRKKLLVSTKDENEVYDRWFDSISGATRKSLGMEDRH